MNFYASDSPSHGTDLASQADPMNAANGDNVIGGGFGFDQNAPAAEIGGGAAPAGGKRAAPAKKKLSTGKKIGIAAAVVVGLAAVAVVMTPTPPTVPSGLPRSGQVTAAPAGMLGGSPAPDGGTLMGSAPAGAGAAPVPVAVDAASPAIVETPPSASVAEAPVTLAPAPAATPAAATPAPVPSTSTPVPAAPPALVVASTTRKPAATTPAAARAPAEPKLVVVKSTDPVDLAARVAVLERRLAKYEGRGATPRRARDSAPVERELQPADRSATFDRALKYVGASPAALPQPMQPVAIARPASPVISGDAVRVLGISTRQGVATALVEFGGTKHRVAVGDRIAGLGPVSSVALDAAGNPVIEINGVRYE